MPNATVIQFNIQIGDDLTQNVRPLLHQIKHALDNLIKTGQTSIIDLRSIPLAPGEEEKILSVLGLGEVQAQLHTLGLSEIIETQYTGVWLVSHYNDDEELIGRFIEITTIPEIFCSQIEDIASAYNKLGAALEDDINGDIKDNSKTN